MAVTINASTSAGLVQTADTTGNLNLQSNGTTIAALTSTGLAVTGAGSFTTTLGVTGTSTLAAVNASGQIKGTYATGASTILAENATQPSFRATFTGANPISSTFSTYGNTVSIYDETNSKAILNYGFTSAGAQTITIGASTGAVTIPGTLGVTGAVVLNNGGTIINAAQQTVAFNGNTQNGVNFDNNNSASGGVFVVFSNSGGGGIGTIARVAATSAVVYNTTSDYRIKDLFGEVKNAADLLSKLTVHDGMFKGDTHRKPMLVAHEVQAITPWAVSGEKDAIDKNGNPKYQQLATGTHEALLIAGWQAHEREIQSLRAELQQLKTPK